MTASSSPSWFDDLQISDGTFPSAVRPEKPPPAPYRCANCDALCTPTNRQPRWYCPGKSCRSMAKAVRDARSAYARYGLVLPPDVHDAVHRKFELAVGSGYRSSRRPPPRIRDLVWARDEHRCVLCGQPGEQIDHVDGDSNELSNLRLLCVPCHNTVTDRHVQPIPADRPDLLARRGQLLQRIMASTPQRPCDDHRTWNDVRRQR